MITPGTRVGPYEILGALGAGGMGEVYRARDARLNRDVAIKLLPEAFAADPDRLARFEREAQTLAALNHPNIAQIFGVHEQALVMEFVDGDDLAERVARGPIPLDDAIAIARQIADALEAAHDQGIVHRDLKPANVKVRPDGTVKVLDFGLAKDGAAQGVDPANSPTLTTRGTQAGLILGTAAYMAPEQARGRPVDRRADIWAFGAVLFEMLTGRRAFDGEEISDVLASVLKSDPAWNAMPAGTPASIRRLLHRCLEKDPRKRLSAIGDARFDLDEAHAPAPPFASAASPRPRAWLPYVLVLLVLGLLAGVFVPLVALLNRPSAAPVERFSLMPPAGVPLYPDSNTVAISPDGTKVAFIVGDLLKSETQLWVRSLDTLEAKRYEGGDRAAAAFWSPDSRSIGFFTVSKLKTMPAGGGRAQTIADIAGNGRGAAWNQANVIVFAPAALGPLFRVNATGGTPAPATTLDAARKQSAHRFPVFLPDGDHFLYAALPSRDGRFDIFAGSLSGGSPVLVGALESAPVYWNGYLLYGRQGLLTAQPFDARALKTTGDPITLADEPGVVLDPSISYTAGPVVAAATDGTLAYYSAPSLNTVATWYDGAGRRTGTLPLPPGHYDSIRISPDGTQGIAVRSVSPSESSLWLVDLAKGGAVLLTKAPGRNDQPVWSPDGSRIVFGSDRDGAVNFFVKSVGDASPDRPFFQSPSIFKGPASWSPDGNWIAMNQLDAGNAQNVYALPASATDEPREPRPVVLGAARDVAGPVSPDGKWLAYYSDETGRVQLYVTPFPAGGRRVQVSQDGCGGAAWSRDGRELRFIGDDNRTMWRVTVTTGDAFTAKTPERIGQLPPGQSWIAATPDLQRILTLSPEQTGPGSITIVRNWRAALGGR